MNNHDWIDSLRYTLNYFATVKGEQRQPTLHVDSSMSKRFKPKPTDVVEDAQFEEVL